MADRYTLNGFVMAKIEPTGTPNAGADSGRLFLNDAQTGVMAWWSMGRWSNGAARDAVIAKATTRTLAAFRDWFDRQDDPCGADEDEW